MFVVQLGTGGEGQEELTAVGVDSRISHREDTSLGVGEFVVELVHEYLPEDTCAPSACSCGVTSLEAEVFN